jgi:mycothiol synthase
MKVRTYQNIDDFYAMLDLLTQGRQANNGTYYIHRGDLQWWLFYTYMPDEVWQANIRLWEEDGELIGWGIISWDESAFDVYAHPKYRGTKHEEEMLTSVINEMSALEKTQTIWLGEDDEWRINWLTKNGFEKQEPYFNLMKRLLSDPIPDSAPPAGYSLRHSRGEADAELRSIASSMAFGSKSPTDEYINRTTKFMQSPVYVPEHEIFVMSPENQVASFCIIWTDELNKASHFEPVGTHPDFQGKGLGKNLLNEALRRLKSEGMREASVCVDHDNPNALRLYESVGFQKFKKLLTYEKTK